MAMAEPRTRVAVLVVDFQVGVVRDCYDTTGVRQRAQLLIERARAAGALVVFVQHDDADLPRDSADWQLAPPLHPLPADARVYKTYRDAFADTELTRILTDAGVGRVVVVGSQSDFCVRTTAQRAAAEGYDVTLVSDAHTTWDFEEESGTIPAAQIIAHTNRFFASLRYPGCAVTVVPHDVVAFT